ncbi:MAG: RdgB/HAM1 family non-canonical purine NTP pyrophosphatase [Proteobacteria bacterium]|nr:RdgB/HAM1 family non-canonical purine NTP pyrophosphatase [Burkholderiales bacterium]
MQRERLVIASRNAGKLREIDAILAPLAFEVIPQDALGVDEAPEPHPTFIENALAKARHAAAATGLAALADDSGICVYALAGAPGVHSARYAGEPKSDARNNARLIEALAGIVDRRAHYYCVIVLVRSVDDPQPLIGEGIWRGEVTRAPLGEGGFGYDPWFMLPGLGLTAAQLPAEQKNRVSHRALALAQIAARVQAGWRSAC